MTPESRHRRGHRGAAATGIAAGLAVMTAQTVAAAPGIGLSPGTSSPGDPLSSSYFTHSVGPGKSWSSFVAVTNTGDVPVQVYAYPADGITSTNSGAVYSNRAEPLTRAGAWVTTPRNAMTLSPHATTDVAFTVTVPASATPGDHLAGIAIEPQARAQGGGRLQVTTVTRSVMAVLIQVPPAGSFHLTITGARILPTVTSGTASVVIRIGDDGVKLGKPQISITLTGPSGYRRTVPSTPCATGREFCGNLDTILPGDTIEFPFPWPDALIDGDYTISVSGSWETDTSPVGDRIEVRYLTTYHLATALRATIAEAPFIAPLPVVPSPLPALLVTVVSTLGGVALAGLLAHLVAVRHRRRRSAEGRVPPERQQ